MIELPAVQKALGARDRLLVALLEAWRINHAPELADAIEHVSRALEVAPLGAKGPQRSEDPGSSRGRSPLDVKGPQRSEDPGSSRGRSPLDVKGPKKAYEAWLARAAKADAADLSLLLPDLFDGQPAYIRGRLEALESYGDDPRIGAALAEYVTESGDWLPGTPVGNAIFKALGRHGDARALNTIRASAFAAPGSENAEWRTKKLDALAKAIGKHLVTPLGEKALATLAEVRAIPSGPSKGETSFVEAKNPPERAVATDQLLEEGGPRGEFVILQQTKKLRPLTAAEKKREESLLAAHRKKWMGGVAKILHPAKSVFEDGVLVGGEVECGMDDLAKVIDAPEWSTVRFVDFASWTPDPALLRRWPTITSVRLIGSSDLPILTDADPALAVTELVYSGPDQHPTEAEREALTIARGLPALRHLSISGYWHAPSTLGWIFEGALARRLSRFSYTRRLAIAAFVELLSRAPENLVLGTMGNESSGARIDFTRDANGRFTRAKVGFTAPKEDVRKHFEKLLAALADVPKGLLTHVEIDPNVESPTKAHHVRLEESVGKLR